MNRRQVIAGLLGTAVAAGLPPIPVWDERTPRDLLLKYVNDVADVYFEYMETVLLYGTGAINSTNEYPYIRCVPITELIITRALKGII